MVHLAPGLYIPADVFALVAGLLIPASLFILGYVKDERNRMKVR